MAELSGQVAHHMDVALVWVSTGSGRFELANRTGLGLLGVGAPDELATIRIPPVGATVRDQRLGWATTEDLLYTAALVIADPVVPSAEQLPHMITVIDAPVDGFGGFAIVGLSVEELHSSFRVAFEQANDGMATIDLGGTYLQVNQRLCDMLQRSEAEIVGQHVEAFFRHDNAASFEATKLIVESEGRATFDNVLCRADGAAIYVRVSSALLTTDGGEPLHLIASYTDETERREREASARQREKMEALGQFAGGVAHDINNLLSGVLGYSQLVMAEVTDPTTRGYCEQLISATMRAADFTARLLAFTGEGSTTSVAFDVNTIVTEVADMLRQRVTGDIEVVVNAAPEEMAVVGDPSQIHGALLNLGLNARDAIVDGSGTITFTATPTETSAGDASVRVAVSDTGIGIEPVALAKLFEPFYTTKASGLGTGLGLPSVAAAARQHGGDVTVESVVGMGSTFTIELPIGDVGADSGHLSER
ncbi:MAG TPA: ATP-binding protein [Ilumatobacter sp.]|nr:ATP-binding protein [Ilumatobacter sp.]